jgi:hypothetical protein
MRDDMDKVIVERPRLGSRAGNDQKGEIKQRQRAERGGFEGSPRRQSSARGRRAGWKDLNENLAPLKRFLGSNLGRPWDKVYSEIRQQISPRNAVQMHIWQHLTQFVCLNAVEVEHDRFALPHGQRAHHEFIVHPRTGLLVRNEHRWRWTGTPRPQQKYVSIDRRKFREIKGIWYEVALTPLPKMPRNSRLGEDDAVSPPVFDVLLRGNPTYRMALDFHGRLMYAASKKQLNGKEIRKLGLRPDESQLPNVLR